jgi:hypothetical protein
VVGETCTRKEDVDMLMAEEETYINMVDLKGVKVVVVTCTHILVEVIERLEAGTRVHKEAVEMIRVGVVTCTHKAVGVIM